MKQKRSLPWRGRLREKSSTEDMEDNPVGSRARGLELDLHLREFEINQLTQRNNFFMIFQGVLIAGLVQSHGEAAPIVTFSMSLLGVATAVLQIGMAGGAKYWQSRWEASTRSSEIALVLALLRRGKLAVQTFTHDSSLLTEDEQAEISEWNALNPDEPIIVDREYIRKIVVADIHANKTKSLRRSADWWVRTFAIEPKWSVSRIPIWMGAALLIFWLLMTLHSIRIDGVDIYAAMPAWVELVPLKVDSDK